MERRPIASRGLGWVQSFTRVLVRTGVSPNAISVSSMFFAAAGAAAIVFAGTAGSSTAARAAWLGAAVCVQLRLLANLFDGMVAVEGGRASATGELFNEIPDRVSDTLLIGALGFVPGVPPLLGAGAALGAIFVAYLRAVGASAGAGQVFAGLMAKPQRMFLVTVLGVLLAVVPSWVDPAARWCLIVIVAGCVVTAVTRLRLIVRALRTAG